MTKYRKIAKKEKGRVFSSLESFFTRPDISLLTQANPVTAGIAAYFNGVFQQEQFENIADFMRALNDKLADIEEDKLDKDFLTSKAGKRIIGKMIRSISRDNRSEKIRAMASLAASIFQKSELEIDEKEVYADILDNLNVLQLSILERAVHEVNYREGNPHKGFGWEKLQAEYKAKGISGALLLQSIRALESNGLINQNTAQIVEADRTHFVTAFGEQFASFILDK